MAEATRRSTEWTTLLQLAAGMAVFGSATPVSKLVATDFPTFLGAAFRTALGAVVLLPFAASSFATLRKLDVKAWLRLGMIALFGMFGFSVFMLYGMRMISGVSGSIIMSTTPAITAAGAFLFLHDPLGWRRLLAIALAVTGVLVMNLTSQGGEGAGTSPLLGILLVAAAVCCEAVYTLLGRAATKTLDPTAVSAVSCLMALPLFLPVAIFEFDDFMAATTGIGGWVALAWWGMGTLALGSVLWYSGLPKARGTTAAGFMGIMPVSALVLSYLLLGEAFRWVHLVGFGIVFAGVLLISWSHRRESG